MITRYCLLLSAFFLSGCLDQSSLQSTAGTLNAKLNALVASHQITTWKNNARGAYSIIFDDYCIEGTQGIQDHAAPEAEQRGLVIGFGVVTSYCDAHEWQRAREMIAAGHEIINHSHTHRCGLLSAPWCVDVWSDTDVDKEIDQPAKLIEANTGHYPTFFIFPFDLFTPAKIQHLRVSGYVGTRAGQKRQLTSADFSDPFTQLNFDVKFPPESVSEQRFGLNEFVDMAIASGQLAFREVHGVADQSWGHLSLEELTNHFDYVRAKVQSNELWVATISTIIRYNQSRRLCHLQAGVDSQGGWMQITGDDPICHSGVELSVVFPDAAGVQLKTPRGGLLHVVHGTYNLAVGETYRVDIL